jgi:hypothetical protein
VLRFLILFFLFATVSLRAETFGPLPLVPSANDRPLQKNQLAVIGMVHCPSTRAVLDVISQSFTSQQKLNTKIYYLFKKNKAGQYQSGKGPEEFHESLFQICLQKERPHLFWEYLSVYLRDLSKNEKKKQLLLKGISSQKAFQVCESRSLAEHLRADYFLENIQLSTDYHLERSPYFLEENQRFYLGPRHLKVSSFFSTSQTKEYLKLISVKYQKIILENTICVF